MTENNDIIILSSDSEDDNNNNDNNKSEDDILYTYNSSKNEQVMINENDYESLNENYKNSYEDLYLTNFLIDFYLTILYDNITSNNIQTNKENILILKTYFYERLILYKKNLNSYKFFLPKNVNITKYKYILMPILLNKHHRLIIIENNNNHNKINFEKIQIYYLDSCDYYSKKKDCINFNLIKKFILREFYKNFISANINDQILNKFYKEHINLIKFSNLKVPLQKNNYDCGIYVILYIECFLFKFFYFELNKPNLINWFNDYIAKNKRKEIKNFIDKLIYAKSLIELKLQNQENFNDINNLIKDFENIELKNDNLNIDSEKLIIKDYINYLKYKYNK